MTPEALTALVDATWPAAQFGRAGGFVIRRGDGGGSRVSAASACDAMPDIDAAEAAMRALGQGPLFMIRAGEDRLDSALATRGYRVKDPVTLWSAPVSCLATRRPPPVTGFEVWPPLAIQRELWAEAGIGPARLAVMARVAGPRTTLLGRLDDTPAGCAFVACDGPRAMLHALEVAPRFRRRGLAGHLMRAAAFWARDAGADTLSVLVTRANAGGNSLYRTLGMTAGTGYHYRIHPDAAAA
ncbi:MAG: putative acetyltransferase [Rhodobacteraceae bacterium HLUCCA08]|nr:MAG: putative acetyltransferase [Rhodobacteraceae bacterium HLUCCA08]